MRRITKGVYYDGHERADVIEDREEFLKKMTSLGFLHKSNASNDEVANYLHSVAVSPDKDNTIFWFHDESTFNANKDEPTMWNAGY